MLQSPLKEANLKDYIKMFFRRKWHFLLPVLILMPLVTVGTLYMPKIYRGSVYLLIEEPESVNPLERPRPVQPVQQPSMQQILQSLQEQILAYPRLVELIVRVGLLRDLTNRAAVEETIDELLKRLSVRMEAMDVFSINYEDKDPVMAAKVANTLAQIFIEWNVSGHRSRLGRSVEMIQEQLAQYEKKMRESREALRKFREEHLLAGPGFEQNANINSLIQIETSLAQVRMDLEDVELQIKDLEDIIAGKKPIVSSESTRQLNPLVDQLTQRLGELEVQLSSLRAAGATDAHPAVVSLKEEIERIKKRIAEESMVKASSSSNGGEENPAYKRAVERLNELKLRAEALRQREKTLQKEAEKYRKRVEQLPMVEQELARLQTEAQVNANIYSALLQELEAQRINQAEVVQQGVRYSILSPARVPIKPVKPRLVVNLALSFAIGLLMGFGFVFLAEMGDRTIHDIEEAKRFLTIPVLAAVPKVPSQEELERIRSNQRFAWIVVIAFFVAVIAGMIWSAVTMAPR